MRMMTSRRRTQASGSNGSHCTGFARCRRWGNRQLPRRGMTVSRGSHRPSPPGVPLAASPMATTQTSMMRWRRGRRRRRAGGLRAVRVPRHPPNRGGSRARSHPTRTMTLTTMPRTSARGRSIRSARRWRRSRPRPRPSGSRSASRSARVSQAQCQSRRPSLCRAPFRAQWMLAAISTMTTTATTTSTATGPTQRTRSMRRVKRTIP
mmetsp:Transcript_20007/g.50894  ORF Transcript_20007/g.50894 Transcript_20007/m.50894 type:complete len:207 (-) Transcript_20007:68-688(-)